MSLPTIFYDKDCGLCQRSVAFIRTRDAQQRFSYEPLQSERGAWQLEQCGLPTDQYDTLLLVDGQGCATRSTAALRIARMLGMPWSMLYAFIVIPRVLRDAIYDLVARTRHRWSGCGERCSIPGRR